MDNNYLYIIGFLGILLVAFVFYYFTSLRKQTRTLENMESTKIPQDDHQVECDGDKCFIKPKYDKCDYETHM
jgi:hypothetical protein